MKYSVKNPPLSMFMTQSVWYKTAERRKPNGILWLSSNKDNSMLNAFCQPDDNAPDRQIWLDKLGINKLHNDWNHSYQTMGFNCWIGRFQDGRVSSLQVSPWDLISWDNRESSIGSSCSDGWIKICICEDSLKNPKYFNDVYNEACEITAYLCKEFGINPNGIGICDGLMLSNVTNDFDAKALGIYTSCSNLKDWMSINGKNMSIARQEINKIIIDNTSIFDDDSTDSNDNDIKQSENIKHSSDSDNIVNSNCNSNRFSTCTKIVVDNVNENISYLLKAVKVIKAVNPYFNVDIIKNIFSIAPIYNLDPVMVTAQSIIETDFFRFSDNTLSNLNKHKTAKQYQNNFCNLSMNFYTNDDLDCILSFDSISAGIHAQCQRLYAYGCKSELPKSVEKFDCNFNDIIRGCCTDWENLMYYWPIKPGFNDSNHKDLDSAIKAQSSYGQHILHICNTIKTTNIEENDYIKLRSFCYESDNNSTEIETKKNRHNKFVMFIKSILSKIFSENH